MNNWLKLVLLIFFVSAMLVIKRLVINNTQLILGYGLLVGGFLLTYWAHKRSFRILK